MHRRAQRARARSSSTRFACPSTCCASARPDRFSTIRRSTRPSGAPPLGPVSSRCHPTGLRRPRPGRARARWRRSDPRYRNADAVVAISQHAADEGVRLLGLDQDRLRVAHLGVARSSTGSPARRRRSALPAGRLGVQPTKGLRRSLRCARCAGRCRLSPRSGGGRARPRVGPFRTGRTAPLGRSSRPHPHPRLRPGPRVALPKRRPLSHVESIRGFRSYRRRGHGLRRPGGRLCQFSGDRDRRRRWPARPRW